MQYLRKEAGVQARHRGHLLAGQGAGGVDKGHMQRLHQSALGQVHERPERGVHQVQHGDLDGHRGAPRLQALAVLAQQLDLPLRLHNLVRGAAVAAQHVRGEEGVRQHLVCRLKAAAGVGAQQRREQRAQALVLVGGDHHVALVRVRHGNCVAEHGVEHHHPHRPQVGHGCGSFTLLHLRSLVLLHSNKLAPRCLLWRSWLGRAGDLPRPVHARRHHRRPRRRLLGF
mmetsp:Transcript_48512/g.90350  ORF Transcript_48512/g.90350 Transcript_48512/m.90350 type:complete len:227 (-) Transcript_48512:154-834(-)